MKGYICRCRELDSLIHISCERSLGEAPYYLSGFKLRLDIIGRKKIISFIIITTYVKISFGRRLWLSIKGCFGKIKMLLRPDYIPHTVEAELREDLFLEFQDILSRICELKVDEYTLIPSVAV